MSMQIVKICQSPIWLSKQQTTPVMLQRPEVHSDFLSILVRLSFQVYSAVAVLKKEDRIEKYSNI